jgi:hypothetical protein
MASAAVPYPFRAQRFPLRVPLHYQKSGMTHWNEGRTLNISCTGILFQADESLPQNTMLDIRVDFPSRVTLSCQASVVRAEDYALAVRIHRYHLNQESHE